MRLVVGILVCMGAGAIAAADTPPPAPTQPAASSVAAPAAPAAAPSTASAASTSHDAAAAVDPREKMLKARGYHVEMRLGEKLYCRSEQVLGSRVPGKKICGTADELQDREHSSKEMTESAQRMQLNPTGK
jgi:hypothetical protein